MDIYSTQVLAKVVERLHTPPSFLLDTFFPNVQTSDKEEIFFDVTDSKPRISPFVSPLLPVFWNGKAFKRKTARKPHRWRKLKLTSCFQIFGWWRRTFVINIADYKSCWKRKKTSPRPSQMALRRRAKLLCRMLRVKSALSVPQMPLYRNNTANNRGLSGLGGFIKTFRAEPLACARYCT